MASLGPVHLLILLIVLTIFWIPAAVILKRAGYHPAWILLAFLPGGAIIGLWIFAFAKWPALSAQRQDVQPTSGS